MNNQNQKGKMRQAQVIMEALYECCAENDLNLLCFVSDWNMDDIMAKGKDATGNHCASSVGYLDDLSATLAAIMHEQPPLVETINDAVKAYELMEKA